MSQDAIRERERELLEGAVARLRASVMAVVFGLTAGTGLLAATLWLVIRDGPATGRHLALLRHYFPGYSVSWGGAFVGFLYGALTGAVLGFALAFLYNRIADVRRPA